MRIEVSNIIRIDRNQRDVNVNDLRSQFTFDNPQFFKTQALGFSTYGIPRTIPLLNEKEDCLELPRGVIGDLRKRYQIEIEEKCVSVPVDFPKSNITLRNSQIEPVDALMRKNQGVLISPPGTGKTEMMIEVIRRRGQKTLIGVHTTDLVEQWKSRLKKSVNIDAGTIGGGRFDVRDATVGTIQSLQKKLSKEFLESWGLICVDEAHHIPAWTFRTLFNQFPAKYRYGLTATPNREDGLTFLLHAVMGPIIYEVNKADLLSNGDIIKPKVIMIHTNFHDDSLQDYGPLLAGITKNQDRNSLILKYVKSEAEAGHACLVLSERIEHARNLGDQFEKVSSIPSKCITSKSSKKVRERALQDLNDGTINVLFSTRIADEGLDVPQLDRLFLTCPIRSVNKVNQQVGRIQRKFPGKRDAVVFDFVDSLCGLALSQSYTRRNQAYRGYEITEKEFVNT